MMKFFIIPIYGVDINGMLELLLSMGSSDDIGGIVNLYDFNGSEVVCIPAEVRPYANNYKMILVEARQNSLTFSDRNNVGRLRRNPRFFDKRKNVK